MEFGSEVEMRGGGGVTPVQIGIISADASQEANIKWAGDDRNHNPTSKRSEDERRGQRGRVSVKSHRSVNQSINRAGGRDPGIDDLRRDGGVWDGWMGDGRTIERKTRHVHIESGEAWQADGNDGREKPTIELAKGGQAREVGWARREAEADADDSQYHQHDPHGWPRTRVQ